VFEPSCDPPRLGPVEAPALRPPASPGYHVVGLLGRGGSSLVELAVDPSGRPVATKRLALSGSAAQIHVARQRLRREAEILGALAHPGIVAVLDVIDDGTEVILVLPVLAESLEDRVERLGPLAPVEVARIGRILIDALATAHRQGVVHRDIKPANVLFDRNGNPALADFGVAVTRDITAGLTRADTVVGTPRWMAPEQARGEPAGPASDVFSLAATLVYAASGQGPYGQGPPEVVMARAARNRIRPIPPSVPSVLRRPLSTMLRAQAARRPSAAGVLGGLTGTIAAPRASPGRLGGLGRRLYAAPPPHRGPTPRWALLLRAAAAVAAVALVAGVVIVGMSATTAPPARRALPLPAVTVPVCTPLAYQRCDQTLPAPNTDGNQCLPGWYDLDNVAANGCEAHSDYVVGTRLVARTPVAANLVPVGASDSFSTTVEGHVLALCWGALNVTLIAPTNTAERMTITNQGRTVGSALSANGTPATATVHKPSCWGADREILQVTVTAVAGPGSTQDFVLTRDGGW